MSDNSFNDSITCLEDSVDSYTVTQFETICSSFDEENESAILKPGVSLAKIKDANLTSDGGIIGRYEDEEVSGGQESNNDGDNYESRKMEYDANDESREKKFSDEKSQREDRRIEKDVDDRKTCKKTEYNGDIPIASISRKDTEQEESLASTIEDKTEQIQANLPKKRKIETRKVKHTQLTLISGPKYRVGLSRRHQIEPLHKRINKQ